MILVIVFTVITYTTYLLLRAIVHSFARFSATVESIDRD